jgi:hypothetical protein
MVQNRLRDELIDLKLKYSRMKGMSVTKKKEHAKAYQPVHT